MTVLKVTLHKNEKNNLLSYLVSDRKHNKIKIDSFEFILLFFSSADAKASPKERKSNRSKASSLQQALRSA
jgi:hypothetical protein